MTYWVESKTYEPHSMKKQLRSFLFFCSCLAMVVSILQYLNVQLPMLAKQGQVQKEVQVETPVASSSAVLGQTTEVGEIAVVKKVVDGDTIELENGVKVRYIGVDTPESKKPNTPVQCFALEAANRNKELVEGKEVKLVKDVSNTDKYGRLLRYVYLGDELINNTLVQEGFAFSRTYPPDVAKQEQFGLSEVSAREGKKGLWAGCPVIPKGKKGEWVMSSSK